MCSDRLYIATRDPSIRGGVPTMAAFVYDTADAAGYDPCLVYNILDADTDIRIRDILTGIGEMEIQPSRTRGMEGKGIPRLLPEIEFIQYLSNGSLWREAISDGDIFLGVGGVNQCCLPLARYGIKFGSWTATLLWDDRVPRLSEASTVKQLRDGLSRPILEQIERYIYETTNRICVMSEYTAGRLASQHGIDSARIDVIPYPIDTSHFHPDEPKMRNNNRKDNGPVVLFVGRLDDPRKRVQLLVEAFQVVREVHPDATLRLVGAKDGENQAALIGRNHVPEGVEIYPFASNERLPAYYRDADVFVIPSDQEGLAIVGLEAMACGTPVVATQCGGPEDYVVDGVTGYTVPCGDADALADCVNTLLSEPNTREKMGRAARRKIETEYSETEVRPRFESLLNDLSRQP